jgi:hypothetical protein
MGNLIGKRGRSELNRPASSLSRPISPVPEFRQLPSAPYNFVKSLDNLREPLR